jgi:hypothetical protein
MTLAIDKVLTIKESESIPGLTKFLINEDEAFTLSTKELEIITAFCDKVLG